MLALLDNHRLDDILRELTAERSQVPICSHAAAPANQYFNYRGTAGRYMEFKSRRCDYRLLPCERAWCRRAPRLRLSLRRDATVVDIDCCVLFVRSSTYSPVRRVVSIYIYRFLLILVPGNLGTT